MKRLYTLFVFTLLIAILASGCSKDDSKSANGKGADKVRFGVDTAAGGSFQIRAAAAKGYFKNHGIDPQLSNFAYGIDTINALLTETTDTGTAADYALLNSLNRGNLVVLSSLTHSTEETIKQSELLAVKGIDKPEQLKGKNIGVAKGTVSEYHWAKYLEKIGIDEKDVNYVPYSTPDEAIVGVKKGDIDAVITFGALVEKFRSIEGVHKIDDLSTADVSISSYLVANKTFVESNPKAVENLLKAIKEGMAFVKENPDGTADIAYKELKINKEDALRDLKRSNYTLEFKQEDFDHLAEMQQWIVDRGLQKEKYDLNEKLYLDPLKKAFPDAVTYKK